MTSIKWTGLLAWSACPADQYADLSKRGNLVEPHAGIRIQEMYAANACMPLNPHLQTRSS
jgi:hypothetical protein